MSNICKTVTLRTRKIKNGTMLSFYLDYYPGYRDESTMKVMRHESLFIGFEDYMTQAPLRKWLKAASITKHISFHCTRHTFGTLQVEAGTPVYTVQHMLGHKNVETTQIYADMSSFSKQMRRKFLCQLGETCRLLATIWAVVFLLIIANDNYHLREKVAELHRTEQKYKLLRKASKAVKQWSDKADEIEFGVN